MAEKLLLEDVLGARNKIKLLRLLINNDLISFSEIRKKLGLNHVTLKEYLNMLIEAGIVKEYEISRFRIYSIRKEDPRVKSIIMLFKTWEESYEQ